MTVLQKVKFVAPLLPNEPATVSCQAIGDQVMFSVKTWRDGILTTLAEGHAHLAHQPMPSPPPSATPAGRSFRE
ncbi:MAG TPA: hypothetical protein VH704_09615 [Casimicrobiaceae bacterium]|nr:hypothetical protein [Casimicrobiaceae bacterium]